MWNINEQEEVLSKYRSYLESASSLAWMGRPTAAIKIYINAAGHNVFIAMEIKVSLQNFTHLKNKHMTTESAEILQNI